MKHKKIIIPVFLVFILAITLVTGIGKNRVNASSIPNSIYYTLGIQEEGVITENGEDRQYYMFTLPSSGSINIKGYAYMAYIGLSVYDENADEIWRTYDRWNDTSEVIPINHTLYLTSGVYFFVQKKIMDV